MKLHNKAIIIILLISSLHIQATEPYFPSKTIITSGNYYSVFIMDQGKSEVVDLSSMLLFYNANLEQEYAEEIARIYLEESISEGVNHDIAFCQMILETGFLNYGGSVKKSQYNYCGLGATASTVAGEVFPDIRTGIRAHIQHLKAYASFDDIQKESVDRRFRFVKRGSATNIYALPGKWASDPYYDKKIENLMERLFAHRSFYAQHPNSFTEVH
ncbi:MAG: glucosaminidase [Bacteroidales bacterium]|nr:glucosaminidase [Bacteroidales bacterium]